MPLASLALRTRDQPPIQQLCWPAGSPTSGSVDSNSVTISALESSTNLTRSWAEFDLHWVPLAALGFGGMCYHCDWSP